MREKLLLSWLKAKATMRDLAFEEKGASEMVAVIVLIVIILAVAIIFREKLSEAVEAVFGNLMDFIG